MLNMAKKPMLFKYVDQVHRVGGGQDRHVHAEAAVSVITATACTATSCCGRTAKPSPRRRDQLRRPVRHRPPGRRRAAQARAVAAGVHQPDGEKPTTAGCWVSRCRSTWSTRPEEPVGLLPHPADWLEPEGQSGSRSGCRGPARQPVPRVLGDAYGGDSTASRTRSSPPRPLPRQGPVLLAPGPGCRGPDLFPACWPTPCSTTSRSIYESPSEGGVFTEDPIETGISYQPMLGDRRGAASPYLVRVLNGSPPPDSSATDEGRSHHAASDPVPFGWKTPPRIRPSRHVAIGRDVPIGVQGAGLELA